MLENRSGALTYALTMDMENLSLYFLDEFLNNYKFSVCFIFTTCSNNIF